MAYDLHDRFSIHSRIRQVCHSAVPKVVEDKIFNALLFTKPVHLPIGMVQFAPILVEYQSLNGRYSVKASVPL